MCGIMPSKEEGQMPKIEPREGDTLTLKVKVTRVSDDGEWITIDCWGQKLTGKMELLHYEKIEKGDGWPKG